MRARPADFMVTQELLEDKDVSHFRVRNPNKKGDHTSYTVEVRQPLILGLLARGTFRLHPKVQGVQVTQGGPC